VPTYGFDATYSVGRNLSGVGVYSRELMWELTRLHAKDARWYFYYRPNRLLRSIKDRLPRGVKRRLLQGAPRVDLFHALNQRVDHPARRTVTTFHDLFVMTSEYSTPDFRARFTQQAREAAKRSDAIISVSQFTADHIERLLGVEPKRIHIVPHGVHVPPASQVARENLVLFSGVIQKRKNLARVVKAFEQLPAGWRLVVAGGQEGYGAADELRAVEESPRRGDIRLAGHVSRSDLDALYARARVLAFPSLDEGFGMPILEAMANGVAVVTSRISAMPEVAGDAALLVDPLNVDEIAHALLRAATDDELRARLIPKGLDRARQFSWEDAAEKTWQVYQTL